MPRHMRRLRSERGGEERERERERENPGAGEAALHSVCDSKIRILEVDGQKGYNRKEACLIHAPVVNCVIYSHSSRSGAALWYACGSFRSGPS